MVRVKTYEAIVKGENIPDPGVPESFKVLIKELQSLALDVKVLSADQEEIIVRDSTDDEADYNETMLAEQEARKAAIHKYQEEDEVAIVGDTDGQFTDDDDDFSLDSLFDSDEEDALAGLFGASEEEGLDLEDDQDDLMDDEEDDLDASGLDSLLEALGSDEEDDDLGLDFDDEDDDLDIDEIDE